jgi:hypothetical protein
LEAGSLRVLGSRSPLIVPTKRNKREKGRERKKTSERRGGAKPTNSLTVSTWPASIAASIAGAPFLFNWSTGMPAFTNALTISARPLRIILVKKNY